MRTRILLGALLLLGAATAQGQQCTPNCTNLAPTGDMMQIPFCNQGSLNTLGTDWMSSHGSPSYCPGQMWMWSYNSVGEGVYYQGFNFVAGRTYCVTIDTYTRTHNDMPAVPDAGFRVVATSSMVPNEMPSFGGPIPAIPALSDVVADVNWATLPMNGWSTFSYTFTASGNWSQLWFYPHASALPQVELTLRNLRICDITVPNPCEFDLGIDYSPYAGCAYQFYGYTGLPAGLTVISYLWDFGDGTTSNEQNPVHYYSSPGGYLVRLTVLVVNENGKCCARTTEVWVESQECDPCKIVDASSFNVTQNSHFNFTFTATGPNLPNYAYHWDFGDGNQGTGHSVNHTYTAPGTYLVTLNKYYFDADAGICCWAQITKEVKVKKLPGGGLEPEPPVIEPVGGKAASPTGTEIPEALKERPSDDGTASQVGVFPNPTGGSFTVMSMTVNIERITITDAQGRLIQSVKDVDKKSTALSLQNQKAGTYTITVELVNGTRYNQTIVRN